MIAKLRRWVTPFFTRLNGIMNRNWKYHGYAVFPDYPYYFENFVRHHDLPQGRPFNHNWERLL